MSDHTIVVIWVMKSFLYTAAKSLQSCPTLRPHRWQPIRLPGPWDSPSKNTGVGCHFLLQCMKMKVKSLSRIRLSGTPWTAAHQAPPSMGFSRQEYWSGGAIAFSKRKHGIILKNSCISAGDSSHGRWFSGLFQRCLFPFRMRFFSQLWKYLASKGFSRPC